MHKKIKVCYILPFFDEKTDTHLFYNYELIKEAAEKLDIFVVIERVIGDPRKLGCKFKVQKFKNPVSRFLELFFIVKMARLCGYVNFYTHYSYYGALTSWIVTFIFGGRVFYWNRGMPWLFERGFVEERTLRFILRHTILVTSPESLAKEYRKIYRTKEHHILSNWIDHERYTPQKTKEEYKNDLGLNPNKKYILFVHHLSERKGADFIAPVAEKFKDENVEFLVAGDGPYLPQGVNLLGKISQREIVKYFHACDVFFMPSREEGSPHVILEAMAAGTPFIASNVGGIQEIIPKNSEKFLCEVGNIDCFAQKIKTLLDNKDIYDQVQKTNLEFVKNFSKAKAVQGFCKLFEKKIYYVANARFPTEKAHGIQMAKMIEAMLEVGANIEIVVPKRDKNKITVEEFYGLSHKIPVKKLFVLPFYNLGKIGFWLGSISFALEYWLFLVWKKIHGEKFTIYTIDIDQFSFFAVPFVGVPYFVEIHDAKTSRFFFNLLFKNARGIIVINNLIKETIAKEFFLPEEKIIVHPNGIDLGNFRLLPQNESRQKLSLPKDDKIALYVGKFYNWKGLGILSKTAQLLPSIKFYLVGGSKEELKKVSGVLVWPENVLCVGHRDFKEMPLWLASANVLLVLGTASSEYSYKHTSPMKLFEYMASQKPIIASKTPAIEQIVSKNEVEFYEPDNAEDLADAISRVLENQSESQKKSQNAHEKVQEFTWNKRAKSVLKFIGL